MPRSNCQILRVSHLVKAFSISPSVELGPINQEFSIQHSFLGLSGRKILGGSQKLLEIQSSYVSVS